MRVAFIIPCLNEDVTIARVVAEARAAVPGASVYVFDNLSTDRTAEVAAAAGAIVILSPTRGKGAVVRHAFATLRADYFVMIDGDGTYPVAETKRLIEIAVNEKCDMVCGARLQLGDRRAFRPLHFLGNLLFTGTVRVAFGRPVADLLTGFRVFSAHFARTVQITSDGFEVETELTIRAMLEGLPFRETPVAYAERPVGSHSKLRTFRDGFRILRTIARLVFSRRAVRRSDAAGSDRDHDNDRDRRPAA